MERSNYYETYVNDGGVHDRRLSYVLVFLVTCIFVVVSVGSLLETMKQHDEIVYSITHMSGYEYHEVRYDDAMSEEVYFVYFENGDSYRYWFDEVTNEVTREKVNSYRL